MCGFGMLGFFLRRGGTDAGLKGMVRVWKERTNYVDASSSYVFFWSGLSPIWQPSVNHEGPLTANVELVSALSCCLVFC